MAPHFINVHWSLNLEFLGVLLTLVLTPFISLRKKNKLLENWHFQKILKGISESSKSELEKVGFFFISK